MIKIKVDSVRKAHNCAPLANDSILYVASKHHSNYMIENNKLTHHEKGKTKTPQLRVKYYGGKNYLVGENVLKTNYNTTIKSKKGKLFDTKSYGGLASSIVNGWVNSPGHFKNIITPSYSITGVTVSLDKETNTLYTCQKFAQILYQYSFTESKTMFPYSEYKTIRARTNFDNIGNQLLKHGHEWNVKHNKLEKCDDCLSLVKIKPAITLRYEKRNFILRIENSGYVKELLKNRKDGFAVEIVEYNDYVCGNPEYYTKPSRRNRQCKLNGILIKPLYRNNLYRGYKKRKVDKEVKFLSYIFGSNSVPFFKRFYNYKVEKFSSEYFEIKMGKLPKNVSGLWAHNLVYLQKNQICNIDYFTGYCGELLKDSTRMKFLPYDTTAAYTFKPDTTTLSFEIPFQKNKSVYTEEDINPFITSLSNQAFTIDSIHIKASSSIEGDSITNSRLQTKRAENIVNVLQVNQNEPIKTKIETYTDWDHFYKTVKTSSKWRFLSNLNKPEVLKKLNNGYSSKLEYILAKERKANIELYCTIDTTTKNLEYLILKEYNSLLDSLRKRDPDITDIKLSLYDLDELYKYTYKLIASSIIDSNILSKMAVPNYYNSYIPLCEKFIQYGYQYPEIYSNNQTWVATKIDIEEAIFAQGIEKVSLGFLYSYSKVETEKLMTKENVLKEEIVTIFKYMERLKPLYIKSESITQNIDKMYFNLNMILLNSVFIISPTAHSKEAYTSIKNIYQYYSNTNQMNDSLAFKLAKLAVHYQNNSLALKIVKPYISKEYILSYGVPLEYRHISDEGSESYYNYLIKLSNTMTDDGWCNLFMNECKIPFQAFDHEELRNTFCKKCVELNETLIELNK